MLVDIIIILKKIVLKLKTQPMMKKFTLSTGGAFLGSLNFKIVLVFMLTFLSFIGMMGQVSVAATLGTASGSYSTVNAAFTAINAGTHRGVVTITVTANTTEPATPVQLLASGTGSSSYTGITIKPGSAGIVMTGTASSGRGVLELVGADNVTIDGSYNGTTSKDLTIQRAASTTTYQSIIRVSSNSTTGANGANNITIKNCNIIGSRNSASESTGYSFGIVFVDGTSAVATAAPTGNYSSLNTIIQNNTITRAWNGIYAAGGSLTYPNTGLQIIGNVIGSATSANNIGLRGVFISNTATSSGGAIIEGNDIRVGDYTTGGGYSATISGIEVGTSNNGFIIRKNNIHDINQPTTIGYGAHGIYVTGSTNNTSSTIENNFIRDIKMYIYHDITTNDVYVPAGVFFNAGATGVNFNHNTIVMNSQLVASTAYSSFCVNASVNGVRFNTFYNNILVNNHTSTSAYGFYTNSTANISGGSVNNNDYYVPGGNVGYYNGSNQTFASWKSNTGKDAAAQNANPPFVSTSDLHLNIAGSTISSFEQQGSASAGVTTDIDGDLRPNSGTTNPDIGADEVIVSSVVPTITLSSNNIIAGNIVQNTNNNVLYSFAIGVANNNTSLTGLTATTSGTYASADLTNLKVWYQTSSTFNSGTATLLSTLTTPGVAGSKTFPSFVSQGIASGATGYIFMTADVPCLATAGNVVAINAITSSNTTFSTGTVSGTPSAGNSQAISLATPNNVTSPAATVANASSVISWVNPMGCYTEVLIVARAVSANDGTPSGDGSAYTANLTYGSGTALGSGFVVYKGSASSQTISGLTNGTAYYYKLYTRNGTNWSSGIEINRTPSMYCAPAMTSVSASGDYIANVTFAGINNNSGDTATDYTYYTTPSASVNESTSYPISLLAGGTSSTYAQQFGVWIDYNHNGVFTDAGEFVFATTTATFSPTASTGSIAIPAISASVLAGKTRMRVGSNYNTAVASTNSCVGASSFGEYEDYDITISALPACATPIAPTALNLSQTSVSSSAGTFTASTSTGYIVVRSTTSTLSANPVNGTTYTTSSVIGGGNVISVGTSSTFSDTSLVTGTPYYYFVYAYNNTACSGGPTYSTAALIGNITLACPSFNSVISIGGSTTTAGSVYPSLTAAIADLSSCGIAQPTTLSLNSSYVSSAETFPIVIPNISGASSTNTLTIKPASGVSPIITSVLANNAIIRLNGSQYVIIDGSNTVGGVTKDMTIRNTSTTGNAVLFINGASNNTVKNNVINAVPSSSATYLGVVTFSTASASSGNNNNTIRNNNITPPSTTLPYIGVYNYGSSTALQNTGNSIVENNIYNFSMAGVYDDGYSSGYIYDGNNIYGTITQTTNTALYGIFLGDTNIYSPIIRNNKIYDLKTTNTNTSTTTGTGYLHGIDIYDIASGSTCYIYNNMISLSGNGAGAPGIRIAGIADESTAGTSYIYYNSVSISGAATSTNVSFAYLKNYTNTSVLLNNIFSNVRLSTGSGSQYAIGLTADAGSFTSDYNDFYSSGNTNNILGSTATTNRTTIAAWQTATTQDSHSINSLPQFVSATDLHITASACTALESAGTPIVGFANDIDNDVRSAATPDIGADEFSGNIPPKVVSVVAGSNCGVGTVSLTANGSTTGATITEYRWYSASTGGTLVGTSTTNVWTTPSISTTTNYYVVAYNGCESETRTLVTATINPAPTAISVSTTTSPVGGDACTTDYVKLEATGGLVSASSPAIIGTGTSVAGTTAYPNPLSAYYGGVKHQMIYLASELTAQGLTANTPISSVGLYINAFVANACTDLTIRMKNTSSTVLTGFEAGTTNVYGASTFTPSATGWINFTLTTPFTWDGTSNLIVEFVHNAGNSGNGSGTTVRYTTTTGANRTYYGARDSVAGGISGYDALTSYTSSAATTSRPNVQFGYMTQQIEWIPATGLYTDAALTIPYTAGNFATTLYAAPNGTQAYTAKATLGTCDKTAIINVTKNKREFTGSVDNSWNNVGNWYPNQIPDNSKCANIPAGKTVVINTNAETSHLIIAATGKTTISANSSLKVTDAISITNNANNDNLVLESDAVLLQDNASAVNTGNIFAKRDVKMRKMDYTYWSSPVKNQILKNTGGTTNPTTYSTGGFSEGTPNNRIYQYKESNDTFTATADANFADAKGYAIRGKDTYDLTNLTSDNALKFIGIPNNGSYSVAIQRTANSGTGGTIEHGYNLIGNPYPSNIDFVKFYNLDNNKNIIFPKAWFWTNITPVLNQSGSNYIGNNYATITLSGGTPPTYSDTTITPGSPSGDYTPTKNIRVGQGFIVQARNLGTNQILNFDNTIRNNESGHFYNNKQSLENDIDRYWVKLVSPEKIVNTILVAHTSDASNQYDADYDADLLSVGDDSFYSKLDTHKLQIQGRNVLSLQDVIPLGNKYSMNGLYKIVLGNKEGIFGSNQKIYLHDKTTGTYTDLSEKDYSFNATKGTDETRFELVYKSQEVLGTGISVKSDFTVYKDGVSYVIVSSKKLGKIEMYDTSGKLIKTLNTSETKIRIDMSDVVNGIYVLKVENSGEAKTHKILK